MWRSVITDPYVPASQAFVLDENQRWWVSRA
jgi:hypothetical protein